VGCLATKFLVGLGSKAGGWFVGQANHLPLWN